MQMKKAGLSQELDRRGCYPMREYIDNIFLKIIIKMAFPTYLYYLKHKNIQYIPRSKIEKVPRGIRGIPNRYKKCQTKKNS